MTSPPTRVLIVDDESALLFSLSDYLTFRGCRVDCAHGLADAQALIRNLPYDAMIVGVSAANREAAERLADEVRHFLPQARRIALTTELAALADEQGNAMHFDQVLGRHLPLEHLARLLRRCIAA